MKKVPIRKTLQWLFKALLSPCYWWRTFIVQPQVSEQFQIELLDVIVARDLLNFLKYFADNQFTIDRLAQNGSSILLGSLRFDDGNVNDHATNQ